MFASCCASLLCFLFYLQSTQLRWKRDALMFFASLLLRLVWGTTSRPDRKSVRLINTSNRWLGDSWIIGFYHSSIAMTFWPTNDATLSGEPSCRDFFKQVFSSSTKWSIFSRRMSWFLLTFALVKSETKNQHTRPGLPLKFNSMVKASLNSQQNPLFPPRSRHFFLL